jgi:hypothetical protein
MRDTGRWCEFWEMVTEPIRSQNVGCADLETQMRLIIGIFLAFAVSAVAYDLGVRLPLDVIEQLAIVGVLALAFWGLVSRLSDDEHAHHRH